MGQALQGHGKLAVITGASTGIGLELAKQFAKNGFDIVATAENDALSAACESLRAFGTEVHEVKVDLREPTGVYDLYDHIRALNRPVEVIALNAGVGVGGASFDKTDIEEEIDMIKLNVISVVYLTKLVLKDMLREGHGKILFTSSVASIMPGPYLSVYAGTKFFVQAFSEALRVENKDKGITITALLPGATETEFFHRAHMDDTKVGQAEKDDPALVAKQGYEALMRGDDMVIAGSTMNKIQGTAAKFMPQSLAAKFHGDQSKPNSPDKR
ncbi:SDR family NAD(P)-dependent oxidoreductase [Bdellovibrio sp. HCB274]|uniref:SDR family NAD(P)-dependent oxidoreductase n=1 Tax=Bdellovibrio sp. HCB274 TaxID=3394361 RepID=UPI0039B5132A